ncbi:MAG: TonB-dependent receptor, partial [Bacteroidetes bacterium]|nr:TonB-dependent receptor [Bacteroidota bacterium]
VIPGDFGDNRKSIRLTVDHTSHDGKFGMSASTAYVSNSLKLSATDMTSLYSYAPSYPLYNADGSPNFNAPSGYPFSYTLQPFENNVSNYNGHINLRYTLAKRLSLKVDMGFNNSTVDESQLSPASSLPSTQPSSASIRTSTSKTWIIEPQAEYTLHVRRHSVTFLAGSSWQKNTLNQLTATGTGFSSDALIRNISSATTINTSSNATIYAYEAVFGRISYNWAQEYLLNLSFRRDGSSRFGPGKRFGNFGAVAAGWIFTENKVVKKALPFLSFGKIRSSYGINGNDQIADYGYITTYASGSPYITNSLVPSNLSNPDYRWEQNRKFEAALELGFLKDRVLATASFFRNRTDNQLINYVISPQSGFGSYPANFPALLQNKGWEFELQTKNISGQHFTWKTNANFSLIKNKLLSFPGIDQTSYASQYVVGQPLSLRFAYHYTGLDKTGVPTFEDMDKDNSITSKDRYIVGSNNPLYGGMSNEFSYDHFHLNIFLEYTHISNFDNSITASRVGASNSNPLTQVLDRWQKPGDEQFTNRPKFTTSAATYNARNFSQSDLYWQQYNIFRLRNMSLSYNLPDALLKKIHANVLQFYVLG